MALRQECRGEDAAEDFSSEVAGDSAKPVEVGGGDGGEVGRKCAKRFLDYEACVAWN